jgi:perosamine synthetase
MTSTEMKIKIAHPMIGDEEKKAVLEVLDSGHLAQGGRVKAFEESFAKYCGVKHAIATSSGTSALYTILHAHGIGAGDEVITSAFTFAASANSILYTGARPVFVDIDPATFNIQAGLIEKAITSRTRAILPVHLFGMSCAMDAIMSIAQRHHLVVIEDASQSHGATYKEGIVGSFGDGAFSLYATKNMTSAEGGMITTNSDVTAEKCRMFRQHGMRQQYLHEEFGFNFCMSDVHAAIGLSQLKKLDPLNAVRRRNAQYLNEHLEKIATPYVPADHEHVYNQYTIRVHAEQRDALRNYLEACGVESKIYYPLPLYRQPYYENMFGVQPSLPDTEHVAREVLSLPVHPYLGQSDLDLIVDAVNRFVDLHPASVL